MRENTAEFYYLGPCIKYYSRILYLLWNQCLHSLWKWVDYNLDISLIVVNHTETHGVKHVLKRKTHKTWRLFWTIYVIFKETPLCQLLRSELAFTSWSGCSLVGRMTVFILSRHLWDDLISCWEEKGMMN